MNKKIKIATLQYDITWEDTVANIIRLTQMIDTLPNDVEIIVLPEMFNTGFSMNPIEIALQNGGIVLEWMQTIATRYDLAIVGSVAVEEDGGYYNRLYWVNPDGEYEYYNKKHLFSMAKEHENFKAGTGTTIVNYKGFSFNLQICYDLRFPVWSRRTKANDYHCLLYVANWPAVRSEAWISLLKARAIENLTYVVGVNRVGEDGNDILYDGKSAVFDFKGLKIDSHQDASEGFSIQVLDMEALNDFRKKFPADADADVFEIF